MGDRNLCLSWARVISFSREDRTSIPSPSFAHALYALLLPFLPSFPCPASDKRGDAFPRLPHSLNSNVRLYKYTPSQHFGPHYDDSVQDALTGARSEWTLLIYLTGIEDGVEGGEVRVSLHVVVRI